MLWQDIQRIRNEAPLVHNITNYVVMNLTANALLAIGASPVMAHALDEVEEMAGHSRALVLNMGTLSDPWVQAMMLAGRTAKRKGIPIVFDPVGSGATQYRTRIARHILSELQPEIVRGNASEIWSLVQEDSLTKGVDSMLGTEDVQSEAFQISNQHGSVVSVSGVVDRVFQDGGMVELRHGHPMMSRVTGMGCTATAITGAFAALKGSLFEAAVNGMTVMGISGELAARKSGGPGSFVPNFLDCLSALTEADLAAGTAAGLR